MKVAGLILAGGASRRMGTPKALLRLNQETFLGRLIRVFGNYCAGVTVVLGHEARGIQSALEPSRAEFVINPHWQKGQLSSLQAGLQALPGDLDAVLFTPVDYPAVSESTVGSLIAACETASAPQVRVMAAAGSLWIPRHQGRHGHPVLVSASLIPELLAETESARAVIHRHCERTTYIDVADAGILRDVDTPEAYAALLAP
ncbi:MAG: nucleotidyltransferase family protein [Acidobacteria bacterium]|nr:nucleotidyltransferase family protein [Acidobacteriota bacterium]